MTIQWIRKVSLTNNFHFHIAYKKKKKNYYFYLLYFNLNMWEREDKHSVQILHTQVCGRK